MIRRWMNVELRGEDARAFRAYLVASGITYSSAGSGYGYTYFDVHVTAEQARACDEFLMSL